MPSPAGVSTTEAAVLGLLRLGESSGYDLSKIIRGSVGFFWSPAQSHVYAVLGRLVSSGLARRRTVRQRRRPDKALYRITPAGEEALERWLSDPEVEPAAAKNPFLLKLFLGEFMEPEAVVDHIRRGRDAIEAELRRLEAIGDRIDDEEHPYDRAVLEYGLEVDRAILSWADRTLAQLLSKRDAARKP